MPRPREVACGIRITIANVSEIPLDEWKKHEEALDVIKEYYGQHDGLRGYFDCGYRNCVIALDIIESRRVGVASQIHSSRRVAIVDVER